MTIHTCVVCQKDYNKPGLLTKHLQSENHKRAVYNHEQLSVIDELTEYKIPMRNKDNVIIGYTLVDKEVFRHILSNNLCVSVGADGYPSIYADSYDQVLHRYIYYDFYGNEKKKGMQVNHYNKQIHDNRYNNLRESTPLNTAANRPKKSNSTSQYYGVCYTSRNMWHCYFTYGDITYQFSFEKELHAAYCYDMLIKKHNLQNIKPLNNVDKPEDFVFKEIDKTRKNDLPFGVYKKKYSYGFYYKHKYFGDFKTAVEASLARQKHDDNEKLTKEQKLLSTPIKRNKDGIAMIEIFKKNNVKVCETLIDDDDYYRVIRYKWSVHPKGYVQGQVDGKTIKLSRFIMGCYDADYVVDHKNKIRHDNRKSNLLITKIEQNNQNKSPYPNQSGYIGVSPKDGRFCAQIGYKRKHEYLGLFDTAIEAAKARDKRAIELNEQGANYTLNFN